FSKNTLNSSSVIIRSFVCSKTIYRDPFFRTKYMFSPLLPAIDLKTACSCFSKKEYTLLSDVQIINGTSSSAYSLYFINSIGKVSLLPTFDVFKKGNILYNCFSLLF